MKTRSNIAAALILIALGVWFLAVEFYPPLKDFAYGSLTWPVAIIGVGALLGFLALVLWAPGMWIPACIVGGIGGLLYWQNLTGNWASWAYAWALIPGFVGVGMLLAKVLGGKDRYNVGSALSAIVSSLVMFVIFGAFFGGFTWMGPYWPLLLIAAGLLVGIRSFFYRKH